MSPAAKSGHAPGQAALVAQPATEALVAREDTTPSAITAMLTLAVEKGVDVAALEKLVALHERVTDRAAAREFAEAMARFQAACPPIAKTSTAEIVTKAGGRYGYRYAELDEIARTVRPLLESNGLSYTWDSDMDGGNLRCTCTLRHVNGHAVTARFTAPVDSAAAMSGQQKHAAALTYSRRQSLISVLGLTTCDPDTDAASTETITDAQAAELTAALNDCGGDLAGFLRYMKAESIEAILARDYASAVAAIEKKARAKRAADDEGSAR